MTSHSARTPPLALRSPRDGGTRVPSLPLRASPGIEPWFLRRAPGEDRERSYLSSPGVKLESAFLDSSFTANEVPPPQRPGLYGPANRFSQEQI